MGSPPPEEDHELEIKRESLAILTSMGGTKEYTGVDMTVDDVKKLSAKDVEKYHLRTQAVTGKQLTTGLVENFIKLSAQTLAHMLTSKFVLDSEQLAKDWNKNELLKKMGKRLNFFVSMSPMLAPSRKCKNFLRC